MKRQILLVVLLIAQNAIALAGKVPAKLLPPLPEPLTNNAVVTVRSGEGEYIVNRQISVDVVLHN